MLQSVSTWFGNEAKRIVRNTSEPTRKSQGKAQKNKPGKLWNKRLVAAELHSKQLLKIHQRLTREYTREGQATLPDLCQCS